MQSSIYLNNITCIDHAFYKNNLIIGGSYLASFLVFGNIDDKEQVVIDFSTVKNDIKSIIDDRELGVDHKFWIFSQDWNISTHKDAAGSSIMCLKNKHLSATLPSNCVYIIPEFLQNFDLTTSLATAMLEYLVYTELLKKYPDISLSVKCILSENPNILQLPNKLKHTSMFRYSHGLKNSTSWACTNPLHGHLSSISLYYKESISSYDELSICRVLDDFVECFDNSVFIFKENLVDRRKLEYTSEVRGSFSVSYLNDNQKVYVLSQETTIENLMVQLLNRCGGLGYLKSIGVTDVTISEGLQKGSYLDLDSVML